MFIVCQNITAGPPGRYWSCEKTLPPLLERPRITLLLRDSLADHVRPVFVLPYSDYLSPVN
jgi:hypothetical protein